MCLALQEEDGHEQLQLGIASGLANLSKVAQSLGKLEIMTESS